MVYLGLLLFLIVGVLSVYIGAVALRKSGQSLHQSLAQHSSYVRYMQDKHELNRFGYAQQLTRYAGAFSAFGASFSTLSVLGGALFILGPAVAAGGPAIVGIGWPLLALFAIATSCSLAMLASAFPLAGGCYHWAAACGGRRLAAMAGWLHLCGYILLTVVTNLFCADWINEMVGRLLGFDSTGWSLGGIALLMFLTQAAACAKGATSLGRIWSAMTWLHALFVLGLVASLITLSWPGIFPLELLYDTAGIAPASSDSSLPFIVGLLLLQRLFVGSDAAAQLAEETVDPKINVPWSIYLSVVYVFIFGFVMFVVLLLHFPLGAAGYGSYGVLSIWIMDSWMGWGKALLWCLSPIIVLICWSSGLGAMNTGARMLFAMARDEAVPVSKWLSHISERYRAPVGSVVCTALAAIVIAAVVLSSGWRGSGEGLAVQLMLAVIIAIQLACAIPIALKIRARRQGIITAALIGPWQLGKLSPVMDAVSLVWFIASTGGALWLLNGSMLAAACLIFIAFIVYVEATFNNMKLKGTLRTRDTIAFTRMKMDEMIRIERKFPQQ
ncbi:amino acid permease [Paenibacillus oenotherae]|nr:amino acid permease [Paenibacillus oenotherae]